ncbi:MAG: hypothetical protein JKY51_10480, partial [Opitutaceae bacterium]|nr:hypothetical protein [Opitutaceae bacterium]
ACTTTYTLKVDAISSPEPLEDEPQSYIIVNTSPSIEESDLHYKETVSWVKTAISGNNLYEAVSLKSADILIELDYGIQKPYKRTRVVGDMQVVREPPMIRTVWVETSHGPRMTQVVIPGRLIMIPWQRVSVEIIHKKYLRMTAIKNSKSKKSDTDFEHLWSVSVSNEDTNDDLRKILPFMISVASDFIGKDSGSGKKIRIKEDDIAVYLVKAGMQPQAKP